MRPSEEFQILIVLGKSGSGKGTQVELLQRKFGFQVVSSGNLLRTRMVQDDFVGERLREIIGKGILVPTPIIFHLWLHRFEELREQENLKGIIFEGSPRKVYEAKLLDEVLPFYQLEGNVRVLYVNISDQEATKRLLERARSDDDMQAIRERLRWYQEEVVPVIDYYREKGLLIEVNGEQSVEAVNEEIVGKLRL